MDTNKLESFIDFCDNYQISMEGVTERISNRFKSSRKDFPDIKFQGISVDFGYDGNKYDSMSENEKKKFRTDMKNAFLKAQRVYNKEFAKVLQQLASKANMDPSKVKSMMKLELCNINTSSNSQDKIRFNAYYNDNNKNKELFDGKCIMVHMVIDGNNVKTTYKIFDSKKEWDEG